MGRGGGRKKWREEAEDRRRDQDDGEETRAQKVPKSEMEGGRTKKERAMAAPGKDIK